MSDLIKLLFVVCFFVFAPFALIFSVNTLVEQGGLEFNLPYNFMTWLASVAICVMVGSR